VRESRLAKNLTLFRTPLVCEPLVKWRSSWDLSIGAGFFDDWARRQEGLTPPPGQPFAPGCPYLSNVSISHPSEGLAAPSGWALLFAVSKLPSPRAKKELPASPHIQRGGPTADIPETQMQALLECLLDRPSLETFGAHSPSRSNLEDAALAKGRACLRQTRRISPRGRRAMRAPSFLLCFAQRHQSDTEGRSPGVVCNDLVRLFHFLDCSFFASNGVPLTTTHSGEK